MVRHRILQRMPDFPDLAAMKAWLQERCIALWARLPHGTLPGTIAEVFAAEQAALMPPPAALDGFVEMPKRVSQTGRITSEHNRCSVPASFASRPVSRRITPTVSWLRPRGASSARTRG